MEQLGVQGVVCHVNERGLQAVAVMAAKRSGSGRKSDAILL
jgi:hypothetical protein